jgi:hypothetical protein
MFDIDNPLLEILAYGLLIPVVLFWGIFVLGMLAGGLIGLKEVLGELFSGKSDDLIRQHENNKKYESLVTLDSND